jgi:hypothetical protein
MINSARFHKITLVVWSFILLLAITSIFFLYKLNTNLETERAEKINHTSLLELGYKINHFDDYLTSEARNFAVTANLEHLQNYWEEVLIKKNRENAIENLKKSNSSDKNSQLLIEAKQNSDILIQTEARSMKLVMLANKMPTKSFPQYIINLKLSASDKSLTPNEKVRMAQSILFDQTYYNAKMQVTTPIKKFRNILKQNSETTILQQQKNTYSAIIILYSLLSILVLLLITMVWMKILILKSLNKEKQPLAQEKNKSNRENNDV